MKVGVIGSMYDIRPIGGIVDLIDELEELFGKNSNANAVFSTYSFNIELSYRLTNIFENIRVFAGKVRSGMYGGIYVTQAQTHFKGMIAWNKKKTVYYIGSSNLTFETGGNYGLLLIKEEPFFAFDMESSVQQYKSFQDPLEVIFGEIIRRETGGKCEKCDENVRFLFMKDNLFLCERCMK